MMWELFFTVYITLNSEMIHAGSYKSLDQCLENSYTLRREIKVNNPKAAIAAYCVPDTFIDQHLRGIGWH